MQHRLLTTGALGLALALSTAVSASAQVQTDTTRRDTSTVRSTRSIPVSKDMSTQESTGTVAPMDTTTPAPAPTPAPVDTTPAPAPAPVDTTTQITTDTTTFVATADTDPMGPVAGGWYFGLGGGANIPQGDLGDGYDTGWNAGAMLGWRPVNSIWGIRFDGSYSRMSNQFADDNQLTNWNAMLDLTLDFPMGQNGSSFYLLGGGGLHNFAWDFEGTDEDPNQTLDGVEDGTDFGVNAGAGVNFALGRTNFFVEGRFVNVFNDADARFIPVTAGLKWFF